MMCFLKKYKFVFFSVASPRESSDQQSTPHRRRRRTAMVYSTFVFCFSEIIDPIQFVSLTYLFCFENKATCRICESVMSLNDLHDHSLVCSLVNAESIRELSSAEQLDWLFTQVRRVFFFYFYNLATTLLKSILL